MLTINWTEEVEKRKDELISETRKFLQIPSVLDEGSARTGQPFGQGIQDALLFLLKKGEDCNFNVKNLDGYAGHLEMGQGKELVGILCHIDVVPEGDGWTSPPFAAEIHDGKIIARGAIDDKGPTMAALFAMKIVSELGVQLSKRVRMIIGTDEESTWQCVDHYFKNEEMPTVGFAPDADFPIIYAEKGIMDIELSYQTSEKRSEVEKKSPFELLSFQSGRRLNMVPDEAKALIKITNEQFVSLETKFQTFLAHHHLQGHLKKQMDGISMIVKGKSAHGMEPNRGINAGLYLCEFLYEILQEEEEAREFLQFIHTVLHSDSRGIQLGIAYADEISGELTVNCGLISYEKERGCTIGLNIRYPVTQDSEQLLKNLKQVADKNQFHFRVLDHSRPHHVDQDHELIRTLSRVYEEQTGEKAELLSIGGGTYARSLQAGVAFGPLFPGREDVAHQKDEYIFIEDLLKATAIYAQAIYELAK